MGYYTEYRGRKISVDDTSGKPTIGLVMNDDMIDQIKNLTPEFIDWIKNAANDAHMLQAMQNLRQGDDAYMLDYYSSKHGRIKLYENYNPEIFQWGLQSQFISQHLADSLAALWKTEHLRRSRKAKAIAKSIPIQNRPGWVYVIQGPNNHFKIGRAKDYQKRIHTLSVKLPFPITPVHQIETNDCVCLEKEFHKLFADSRRKGEWFLLSPGELMFIKGIEKVNYNQGGFENV